MEKITLCLMCQAPGEVAMQPLKALSYNIPHSYCKTLTDRLYEMYEDFYKLIGDKDENFRVMIIIITPPAPLEFYMRYCLAIKSWFDSIEFNQRVETMIVNQSYSR